MSAISTKQETESGAVSIAFHWLKNGIPQKGEAVPLKKYSLRDMTKDAEITTADCDYICKELKRRGMLKSYVISESIQAIDLIDYLLEFWGWEKSAYIRERLRKNHGIHKRYALEMKAAVSKYWVPVFTDKMLGEMTRQDLESFTSVP
jgi:hypothetical protein